MLDALGNPQSVLVLGGGSDIATATLERLTSSRRLQRVVLAGRPGAAIDAALDRLRAAGVPQVTHVYFDASDPRSHQEVLGPVFDVDDVDVVLLTFGVLPDEATVADPVLAAGVVTTNFTGAVSALTVCSKRMRAQGHGILVVLSSVSAERPRRSTYLYGATKAGLDAFATGLADHLHGNGVTVVVIRPGFVRTAMTRGLREPPLAVDAEDVADAIVASLRGPSRTVWVPRAIRPVMAGLKMIPRPLFRRLPI